VHRQATMEDQSVLPRRKLAYLLSQYPAVSHTFFLNEIVALRDRGFHIRTASINAVSPPDDGFASRELAECESTYYIKSMPKTTMLRRLIATALGHPAVLGRGLRKALGLCPWNLYGTGYNLLYLAEALLLGSWMRDEGCDHLHVHFSGPVATVAMLTSVAWEIPYSLTVHGPDEFFNIEKFYLKQKIDAATFVTCISHFCRSQLLRLVSQSTWDKFHVCRLGVDEKMFFPQAKPPSESTRLVSVGRLHPSKGQSILLLAVAKLIERGFDLRLDLVGGGVARVHLTQMIGELGLGDRVILHGAMSHARTRTLLQGADIFVLSSFAEGVPVALMEAMGMEIACISTVVAGIPELIRSGEDGLLVAPSSIDELSEAIGRLILDTQLRDAIALAGRKKVLAQYNLSRNADHLANVFRLYGLGANDDAAA
jgi:colanic acid/amylovoran biosynthesis glycosyltransferase